MAERKTIENDASVRDFLKNIENDKRREDSLVLAKLMRSISRKQAKMWGPSIVGFGKHQYQYADGKPGEICKIGFAPRVQALVLYLSNFDGRAKLLKKLGKHRMSGGGCLYINKLDDIDLDVLTSIIGQAHEIS